SVQAKRRVATKSERLFTAAALPVSIPTPHSRRAYWRALSTLPPLQQSAMSFLELRRVVLLLLSASTALPQQLAALAAPPRLVAALEGALTADDATAVSLCAGVASASVAVLPDDAGLQLRVNLRDCRQPPSSQPARAVGQRRDGGCRAARKDSEGADADSNRPPITFKQSVVFAVCGAIIAAFFLVAAVMRFRTLICLFSLLLQQPAKEEAAQSDAPDGEGELQSLRKKSIECRLSEAAAASRSRNSAVAEPPFFIVDFASLDNVQELDAMSEEFAQGAAVAVTTAPAAAAAPVDSGGHRI
uniref:Transmembrane protein n=1 Tax=Macrostomum lignano TaxID=282301 RepID=A0A1I8JQK1_9PLAT